MKLLGHDSNAIHKHHTSGFRIPFHCSQNITLTFLIGKTDNFLKLILVYLARQWWTFVHLDIAWCMGLKVLTSIGVSDVYTDGLALSTFKSASINTKAIMGSFLELIHWWAILLITGILFVMLLSVIVSQAECFNMISGSSILYL